MSNCNCFLSILPNCIMAKISKNPFIATLTIIYEMIQTYFMLLYNLSDLIMYGMNKIYYSPFVILLHALFLHQYDPSTDKHAVHLYSFAIALCALLVCCLRPDLVSYIHQYIRGVAMDHLLMVWASIKTSKCGLTPFTIFKEFCHLKFICDSCVQLLPLHFS